MAVTLIVNNVVYILDSIDMLPTLADRMAPITTNEAQEGAMQSAAGADVESVSNESASVAARLRVLFVEDNDYVRDLTLCLLEGADREVNAFRSAEEALAEFKRGPYDVLITDVNLPKMSGIELAKRLLALDPEMWIIIASGYQLPADVQKLGKHVRAMTKPFESEQIDQIFSEIAVARGISPSAKAL